ncbi:fluoride efflux transporter FluC [Halomarina rubra]|uniref:Fluoride-specific ion channel FluC n=1 Tax=Halomarina rubra TaxID=2071873 RepID=A0ABD6APY5_9EURY|nr:CrcB family protein [Halomarina rubra]
MISPAVAVGLGGVLGAVARHLVGEFLERDLLDTFVVNLLGSFLLGVLVAAPVDGTALLVAGTGFCGAFTTFSTAAVETVELAAEGRRRALAAVALMLGGALAAVLAGSAVGSLV